jgi:hypothetical protein
MVMRLPIDTTGLTFLLVRDVEPVRDFETKRVKADTDGVPCSRWSWWPWATARPTSSASRSRANRRA